MCRNSYCMTARETTVKKSIVSSECKLFAKAKSRASVAASLCSRTYYLLIRLCDDDDDWMQALVSSGMHLIVKAVVYCPGLFREAECLRGLFWIFLSRLGETYSWCSQSCRRSCI